METSAWYCTSILIADVTEENERDWVKVFDINLQKIVDDFFGDLDD